MIHTALNVKDLTLQTITTEEEKDQEIIPAVEVLVGAEAEVQILVQIAEEAIAEV